MITSLLTWLRSHPFAFLPAQADALVAALGLVPDSAKLNRRSFKGADGLLSVYLEGHSVDWIDLTLWSRDPGGPKQVYRKSLEELFERYQRALALVEKREGAPLFEGESGDDGFPEDQSAIRLACWTQPWGRLVLKCEHDGMDVPLLLTLTLDRGPAPG